MKKSIKHLLYLLMISFSFVACSSDDGGDENENQPGIELEDHSYEFYITEGIFAGKNFVGTLRNDNFWSPYYIYSEVNKEKISISFNGVNNFNTDANLIIEENQVLPLGINQSDLENSFINISFLNDGNYPVFRSQSGTVQIENLEIHTTAMGNQIASYTATFEGFFRQINFWGSTEDTPIIKVNGKIIVKETDD